MVMASGPGRRPSTASSPRGVRRASGGEAGATHERLVAYVRALDTAHDERSGVWVEHSYARAGLGGAAGAVRVLLAHREPPDPGDVVDVDGDDPPPPDPPPLSDDDDDDADDADDADEEAAEDWEARLAALAPAAEHARLARGVAELLRRVRLARLAGGRVGASLARRAEARTLRRALAPLWLLRGAAPPPPQWLHAALPACAPRAARREYERLVAQLRRAAPRLAERLAPAAPAAPPGARAPPQLGPDAGPWLVWVGGGRWARRLGALVHTRRVRVRAPTAPPDAWCAAAAASVRAAVADVLAEAGARPVVVGGSGGCAALAAAMAGGARALLALGARAAPGWAGPALLVAGGAAPGGWCGALADALGARQRLLVVAGADDALRLPARRARRLRLDQRALDAHIVEECARWIHEVCEAAEAEDEAEAEAERDVPPAAPPRGSSSEEEEYAHLPLELGPARLVARVSGGTPLALLPPRRAAAAPALAAADIMHMPIVFADDDRSVAPPPPDPAEARAGALTVRSGTRGGARGVAPGGARGVAPGGARGVARGVAPGGARGVARGAARGGGAGGGYKYTRVIVAKRGAAGGRPLLLRRDVRLVPRDAR